MKSKIVYTFTFERFNEFKTKSSDEFKSRFTLKSFFENPNNVEKQAFIEKRII